MLNVFFHLMAQTPRQKQLYIYYIYLYVLIYTIYIYMYTYKYVYIYTCIYTCENTSTSTPKIHTVHFQCAGPLILHHFHPLPTQPGRRYAKLCEVTDGSCMSSGSFEDFFLESSIHRIPNESLSFCISNLYISSKEIEIYTTVQRDIKRQIKTYVSATGRQERKLKEKEWRRQI